MKSRQDLIREAHAAVPPRAPDDPLRAFASEVVLRDHARLLRLTLRRLRPGERIRTGDLGAIANGQLELLRRPWWGRWTTRSVPVDWAVYRVI